MTQGNSDIVLGLGPYKVPTRVKFRTFSEPEIVKKISTYFCTVLGLDLLI